MLDLGRSRRVARERSRWEDVDDYLALHSGAREYDDVARSVVQRVDPTDVVLEMGCGCGLVALRVAPRVRHFHGYDLVHSMLESARRQATRAELNNIDFLEGDVYRIPEPDGSFDAVICVYLLDVVESPTKVLREARRLLRPGGKLISVTDIFVGEARLRRYARQLRMALRGLLRGRVESARPSAEQLRVWHERAGFEVRDSERWLVIEPLWNECLYCVPSDR